MIFSAGPACPEEPPKRAARSARRRLLLCRPFAALAALLGFMMVSPCSGQLCTTSHTTDLYCLLPTAFHTQASPFNAIFSPFGTELGELPTARPGGLTLIFKNGLLAPANESLGGVFSERAETLGRHNVYLGFDYQNFGFSSIDGNDLKNLPIVLYYAPLQVYTTSGTRLDIRAGQYTAVIAAGLTGRIDVSAAVPIERVSMKATIQGNEYGPGGATASFSEYVPGRSSGFSDVVLGTKALILEHKSLRLGAGVDVRLPTGDELNFLGSGTTGVRPYLVFSRRATVSPHVNAGYQWNGASILNAASDGTKQRLPTSFFYTAGLNIEAGKRCTVIADWVGKRYFNAPRLSQPSAVAVPEIGTAISVQPYVGSYGTNDASLGVKAQMWFGLIATANVTLKIDDGGLRARAVPLVGISRSF